MIEMLHGGMREISAQVVKVLFRRLTCTRFLFLRFVRIVSRFRLHTTYQLHEINLHVHGTDFQVVSLFIRLSVYPTMVSGMVHIPFAFSWKLNEN